MVGIVTTFSVLFVGLFGEVMVGEKSQKDGDPNGGSFVP